MAEAYTLREIARAMGVSRQAANKRAGREAWPHVKRPGRGGGRLFPAATLPGDVRLALARGETAHEAAALRLREDMNSRATETARQSGLAEFAALPAPRRERAEARALLARLWREFTAASGLPRGRAAEAFASDYNFGRLEVPAWVREHVTSVCPGSLRNWTRALEREGLARLAGRYGLHRRGTGVLDSDPDLSAFCLAMLKEYPHAHATGLFEALRARFGAERLPSLRAVQRWLSGWRGRNPQLALALSNPDAWRSRYQSATGTTSAGIVRLNQVWELDSTPGDILLSDGTRHTIIGCIDVYSRRLVLHVSRTSSSAAVASCLRRALLAWGVPETARTDNGTDYVSRHVQGLFLGLGIRQQICTPFTPEEKPHIERAFRTFSHDLLEFLSGYVGHNVAERKDIEARRSFAQRIMKQGRTLELRLSPRDLQNFCDRWCADVYARRPHSGLNGRSPWQAATEWSEPLRRIEDERALDVLLLPAPGGDGLRRVGKKGLRIDGGLYDHPALGGREGSDVLVRLDEGDVGAAYVFDLDGVFLCRAVCPEIAGVSRRELAVARKARQRAVLAEQKQALREAARRMKTGDIAAEILAARSAEAARLSSLPRPAEVYETPALVQAGRAARAEDTRPPAPVDEGEQRRLEALAEEIRAPRPAPDMPETRFARALHLEKRQAAGEHVPEAEERWLRGYRLTAEYRGFRTVYDDFGDSMLPFAAQG